MYILYTFNLCTYCIHLDLSIKVLDLFRFHFVYKPIKSNLESKYVFEKFHKLCLPILILTTHSLS